MQRILHLRSSSGFYGAESVLVTLLDQLSEYGKEVHLAVIENYINQNRDLVIRAQEKNIKTIEIPCSKRFDLKSIREIFNVVQQYKIECVHTHDYKSHLYGLLVAKRLKLPCIATLHGWVNNTTSLRFYQIIERILLRLFDSVVTVSPQMEKRLNSGLLPIKHLLSIPNGVNIKQFHPGSYYDCKKHFNWTKDNFVFGIIARLSEEKGHKILLNAFKIVNSKSPGSRLLIIGSGPERESLENIVSDLNLENIVCFAGPQTNIDKIMRCIDCYVSSSLTEGMPMVLLEAMASGTPIIATKVGAVDNMLSNNMGTLVNPDDSIELALAMQNVLLNVNKAKRMADRARRKCIEQYSAQKQAAAYIKLYSDISL